MFDTALQSVARISKNHYTFFLILCVAALLEVMGDVVVNRALQHQGLIRVVVILAGAVVLLAYSLLMNATGRELGPMLATYIACFFVGTQLMKPSAITLRSAGALVLVAIAGWLCWPAEK